MLTSETGIEHALLSAYLPNALYCTHKTCLAVSQPSRRHHGRSAPGPNGLQLLDLVPDFANLCVLATAANHGDSHLFAIVQESLVKMPTRMAHDQEPLLFTSDTSGVSGGFVAMNPITLVEVGETLISDGG